MHALGQQKGVCNKEIWHQNICNGLQTIKGVCLYTSLFDKLNTFGKLSSFSNRLYEMKKN